MIDLTDLEKVKCYLETDETRDDTVLQDRITSVSHRIQNALGRDFERQTYVEIHHGQTRRLYPKNPPIFSVTSIIWDDFFDFTNGFTFTENKDYMVLNDGWDIAYVTGPFPGGDNAIQLTYVGGFLPLTDPATDIPLDLREVVAKQVVFEYRHRNDFGLRDVDFADGSISKSTDREFLRLVVDTLNHYRVTKVG